MKDKLELTQLQKDVLLGALLGDGSLIIHKNGKNAYFQYLSKSKQHVEYVGNFFKDMITPAGIKDSFYFDKRTNKTYFRSSFRTCANKIFTEFYNQWYINKEKIIPENLKLNSTICLIWYIGDGGIMKHKNSEYIELSTHCFTKEQQQEILIPQLKNFNASLMKADKKYYYIYIPHKKEQEFLDYIGPCPFSDYQYKWNYRKYKNKIPENHTDKEREFCNLFKEGMTYYSIAKKFGVEPNVVKYYLIKNKLYQIKK